MNNLSEVIETAEEREALKTLMTEELKKMFDAGLSKTEALLKIKGMRYELSQKAFKLAGTI